MHYKAINTQGGTEMVETNPAMVFEQLSGWASRNILPSERWYMEFLHLIGKTIFKRTEIQGLTRYYIEVDTGSVLTES